MYCCDLFVQRHVVRQTLFLCLGGRSHEANSNRACMSVCVCVCLSALVLKDGEESAGGKCNNRQNTLIART